LIIPEKLYGREDQIAALLAAFDRVLASDEPEMVLISGYSGVGKSSVVAELQKALVPTRGLFAAGKFDQHQRDIPYSTLAQAFGRLVRLLLTQSDAELAAWRDRLVEALAPNGKLMVDLVPELTLVIGEQPPLPDLAPQKAQSRYHMVFRRFIGVFARAEHPLVLFLDDLQWPDAATLNLLEDILTCSELHHLLVIGAYRDNEVDALHPLKRKLDAITAAGAKVGNIALAPLDRDCLADLLSDALRCSRRRAAPLAQLVHSKTGGNPFFAMQFLHALAEENLLAIDHDKGEWSWDLKRVRAKGYTDNVVDLMVTKLQRLPLRARRACEKLACLGNSATVEVLAIVHGTAEPEVHAHLWEALRSGFVERLPSAYRFAHDRIQEAAYSLVAKRSRAETHLRIGRLLVKHTPPEKREEAIFEIVNQFDRAISCITSQDERDELAELNLVAAKRAKASSRRS
jgi:predicted ATPase